MNTLATEQQGEGFYVAQFKTQDVPVLSYYVESNQQAILIDPTYDTQVYEEMAKNRSANLKYIVLTHYTSESITGHLEFKLPLIMGPKAKRALNGYEISEKADGQSFDLGNIRITVIHTPGHTPESASFQLVNAQNKSACIFTGDALFVGDIGRPDVHASGDASSEELAAMVYETAQKFKKMNPELRVYPGHQSGTKFGKTVGSALFSELKEQLEKNKMLAVEDKQQFMKTVIDGIDKQPDYFTFNAHINQEGPKSRAELAKAALVPLSIEEFQKAAATATVFETRAEVPDGIIPGSYWTTCAGPFNWWVVMTIGPKDPMVLIVEEGREEQIVNRILRVGYFNILGFNKFKVADYPGDKWHPQLFDGTQVLALEGRKHLDVRNPPELKNTGYLEGALTIPLPQLKNRVDEVKPHNLVVVNCRTGQRARYAYSVMANQGCHTHILVDKIEELQGKGNKMVKP